MFLAPQLFPSSIQITLRGKPCEWLLQNDEDRRRALREVHALLLPLKDAERINILDDLYYQVNLHRNVPADDRPMSTKEITELSEAGLVEVGAHAITHPMLSVLTAEEQRIEIIGSREKLEQIIGQQVVSFAYPYGIKGCFNQETLSIVKQTGFNSACTAIPGGITSSHDDLFLLPRYQVENWELDTFVYHLESFLGGSNG